jgi:hypothetical protein
MNIKTKTRDPKVSDFSKNELVININEGSLFYKSNKGVHKLSPSLTVTGGTVVNNSLTEEITNEYITNNSTTINNYSFFTSTGNDIYYTLGNVGIGTTTPSTKLHIKDGTPRVLIEGTAATSEDDEISRVSGVWDDSYVAEIRFLAGNDTSNKDNGKIEFRTYEADGVTGTRMIINEVGNVGIGTTSPGEKLELNGNFLLNTGNIRSSGDLNLLTDDGTPHAEDACYVNINSTAANADVNGDLNLIQNHTLLGDSTSGEEGAYLGYPQHTFTQNTMNGDITITTDDYSNGFFAAPGMGNFICEGDTAIGRFLSVGWNTTAGSGASTTATMPNDIPLGSIVAVGKLYAEGSEVYSDIKLKKNITNIENPLDKILSLEGKNYEWKEKTKPGKQYGLIAQEVEKIIPELVSQGETKSVNYTGLIPVLIEAIKDQQKQIDDLKSKFK